MFLRRTRRKKDGKDHEYWSIVENRRLGDGRIIQRHVLYLGEINSSQQEGWRKTIEVFEEQDSGAQAMRQVALFNEERVPAQSFDEQSIVRVRLGEMSLHHPRQWGACWLTGELYRKLELDKFWSHHLPASRKGTRWDLVLQTLVSYRLIDPGSEWHLHRHWFLQSAMGDLLGSDFRLAADDTLYRCLDRLLKHKTALFDHLTQRWKDLFQTKFEILLYDLTSTYFESDPPFGEEDKRRYGYSRDKRSDCVQVVIALVVTTEGFPLAYEVLSGNTADKTTLRSFLGKIEQQYGKAERIWVMDRGIPTEEVLAEMRASDPPVSYIVGTPKGRLSKLEQEFAEKPWAEVRQGIEVKLLAQNQELYVLAQSHDRINKERSMRRRQLKWLWKRLHEIARIKKLSRDSLLLKLGAAQNQAPAAWRLVQIHLPKAGEALTGQSFSFSLLREQLRAIRKREGRYLLRTNLTGYDPAKLWEFYTQLSQVEEAFKNLKGDLSIRPIYHQKIHRIEAHIFVSFLAYCLQVTLRQILRAQAPGLTPRSVLEKFKAVQMIDVHLPTTDGRLLILPRYTQPEPELQLLLKTFDWALPQQPPPRLSTAGTLLKN